MWHGGKEVGSVHYVGRDQLWRFQHKPSIQKTFQTEAAANVFKTAYNIENDLRVNQVRYLSPEIMEMRLAGSRGITTIFDSSSYHLLHGIRWLPHMTRGRMSSVYGHRDCKTVYMHVLVYSQIGQADEVDHISRDPMDNRLNNLRDGSDGVNGRNRSLTKANKTGFNGICIGKYRGQENRWRALYQKDGRQHYRSFLFSKHGGKEAALFSARKFRAKQDLLNDCANGADPLTWREDALALLSDQ